MSWGTFKHLQGYRTRDKISSHLAYQPPSRGSIEHLNLANLYLFKLRMPHLYGPLRAPKMLSVSSEVLIDSVAFSNAVDAFPSKKVCRTLPIP